MFCALFLFVQIPAVKQFGIFMGFVVIFCYLQVLIVLPLALHIWHAVFRYCENCCYYPCLSHCTKKKPVTGTLRLSELDDEVLREEFVSDVHSEENESVENLISDNDDDSHVALISGNEEVGDVVHEARITKNGSPVEKLSSFLQLIMLYCFARPIVSFHLLKTKLGKLRFPVLNMFCIWVYLFSLILSVGLVAGLLKFSDRPPQLFNSNSNIQKLLDLTGNLTESGFLECIGGCGGSRECT